MEESEIPARIGREYYEDSGYFHARGGALVNPDSSFHRYRVRELRSLCDPIQGLRIVDLGCGWGTISFALAGEAERVVGIDYARTSLEICRERLEREPRPGLSFLQADARRTALQGAAWDLVVAADLMEHLYPEDTLEVYREVRRLLRPGGRFVVWTPSPGHILERLRRAGVLRPDPTHVDYKTLPRLVQELEQIGFTIELARYAPSHVPVLRTVERWAQRFIPPLRRRVGVVASVDAVDGG